MLLSAFDAAFHGGPLPSRATPLRMIPPHAPPPVRRPAPFRRQHDHEPSRNLMADTYLMVDDSDCNLGRIEARRLHNDQMIVTTTLGRFVLDADGRIRRGRLNKRSLHGTYTREAADLY